MGIMDCYEENARLKQEKAKLIELIYVAWEDRMSPDNVSLLIELALEEK